MDLGLDGATAVVTGGSKGMGRAIAERLASEGAEVAVMARGREALDDTVAALHTRAAPDRWDCPSTPPTAARSTRPSPSWAGAGVRSTCWSTRSGPAPAASSSSTTPSGTPPSTSG